MVVPGELEGYTVDVIDINVFKSDTITSLTLPETVLELRSNAVTWCENLKSVSLPESLIVINRNEFQHLRLAERSHHSGGCALYRLELVPLLRRAQKGHL